MERLFENKGLVKKPKLPGALPFGSHKGAYYSTPYQPPVAMVSVLTHVVLQPRAIALNLS